jgi:hypothetical protein
MGPPCCLNQPADGTWANAGELVSSLRFAGAGELGKGSAYHERRETKAIQIGRYVRLQSVS